MGTRIILADDHQLMREGLCSLIEKELGMQVVWQASDGLKVVEVARELNPDIVIMDVSMPKLDGIEAARQICAELPSVKVIALSMHSNRLFVTKMFEAGASGYLLKELASAELVAAINCVTDNNKFICSKVSSILIEATQAMKNSKGALTGKESEILKLLASGKTTKQISVEFNKSVQSIGGLRRQIMEKLGFENSAQLIKYAIREGYTTLD
jgi:DNA-binding NarL/FixJ family response regulator